MSDKSSTLDGLVSVKGYLNNGRPPEEVMIMEKAEIYGVSAVLFEASREGKPPVAQAFVFVSEGPADSPKFAETHRQLWSWGGVPLVYRVTPGLVQLFRCAHKADFLFKGRKICKPHKILIIASNIANDRWWDIELILNGSFSTDPWWDAERLCNGTLWDDPQTCKEFLSSKAAAQKTLINEIQRLHHKLNPKQTCNGKEPLRRKLLILSLLIAYLDERKVFEPDYFSKFKSGATQFFQVLATGPALVNLLDDLERRFNGHVFTLSHEDRETLGNSEYSTQLTEFARMVEGKQESNGQLTLWQRYSFADLPVELISHIYQLFVKDSSVAVYTPPFLVRFMLGEVLSWDRLDRLERENEIILDPSCGSGVFLVEAYKRLVLHWRSRNHWQKPTQDVLQKLLNKVHGIDLEEDAVELAAFSLCLALCDALKPEEIWSSVKLFPELKEKSIHSGCFFAACEQGKIQEKIGVIVGNPPFTSSVSCSDAAKRAYDRYKNTHGTLPDKQLAYLFLHESMEMLEQGGVLALLQQYNFLYNQQSLKFRQKFIQRWDVREILDFISVRGLFHKGGGDTKVLVVVAEATESPKDRQILHATFRRSGRTDAEQGFDIDYYDMHWLSRELVLANDGVWRSDLVGGGRVLAFVDRLRKFRTLGQYATEQGWDYGEGFIEGNRGVYRPAKHIIGKPLLPSEAITIDGIILSAITIAEDKPIEGPRSEKRFTPPMLLIREQMDLPFTLWSDHYLTYRNQVVGICTHKSQIELLSSVAVWITGNLTALRAFVAATSRKLFTQKATTLSGIDILSLPYPEVKNLSISFHEKIIAYDIVDFYRDLIRLGEDSAAMIQPGINALPNFNETYTKQINAIYKDKPLRTLAPYHWQGVICQPYIFGGGEVDWVGADELKGKLDSLLREQRGSGLNVTRIARIYDGDCIYLLKPDRLRYWLRSIALRDADETLADLWGQGF